MAARGSLKDVLAAVPDRFGVVRGCWRHFLPRPDDGAFFAERMVVRLARPAHPGVKTTVFHAHQKVAHRAVADVQVESGNHNADRSGSRAAARLAADRGVPFLVPHPGAARAEGASADGGRGRQPTLREHIACSGAPRPRGGSRSTARRSTVDEEALAPDWRTDIAIDTRLRDALRRLRRDGRHVRAPTRRSGTARIPAPDAVEDAEFAAEVPRWRDRRHRARRGRASTGSSGGSRGSSESRSGRAA